LSFGFSDPKNMDPAVVRALHDALRAEKATTERLGLAKKS